MDEGEVAENVAAERVADSYYWHGHFGSEVVDHMEEVTDVVGP